MTTANSKPILCIFHKNCADGFAAAWAVRQHYSEKRGIEFFGGVYGEAPPDVKGREVILVDFSYKRPVLEQMAKDCDVLTILDHHKTAQEDLRGFQPPMGDVIFDMERSGAVIAWEYFHPDRSVPKMLKYIEDRDLWKFQLPFSRAISAYVFSHPYDFQAWDKMIWQAEMSDHFREMIVEGRAIDRKHHKDIAELLAVTQRHMQIGGYAVPVANLPYTMASDATGELARNAPFAACYYDTAKNRVFSLRSKGDFDVSEIAKQYGGDGHKNAAGFSAPLGWEGGTF